MHQVVDLIFFELLFISVKENLRYYLLKSPNAKERFNADSWQWAKQNMV